MFTVCPSCGMYSAGMDFQGGEGIQALAVCQNCGAAHAFLRLPLFNISGASGTGKTTLALAMTRADCSCIHLETDILWSGYYNTPEDEYRAFRRMWLTMASSISQAGRPVALYGSVVPSQLESCPERGYFSELYYLALVCEPQVLAERLKARPAWRQAGSEAFIARMLEFNQWFLDQAGAPGAMIDLLDTSHLSLEETVRQVRGWIAARWPVKQGQP